MTDLSAVAELLDEIARDRCDVVHVGFDFARHERSPGGDFAEAVLAALQLQHAEPDDEGRPAPAPFHHPWGPREAASPDVIAVWEALLDMVRSRAVRARLHDLLWIDRAGEQPFLHATAAINDYVAAAEAAECDALYRAFMLARALELCREINARDLVGSIRTAAQRALTAEIERRAVSDRPGVSVRLLGLLTDLPDAHRPDDLSLPLSEIHTLLEDNHPHAREAIFQLEEKLASDIPDEVVRLQRANVRVWIDWALVQEGGVFRRGALGMALERANNIDEAEDLRREIRLLMQEAGDEDLGLGEIAVESEMPAEQFEELAGYIVGDDGAAGALARFGAWGPPTGDPRANADAVDRERAEFVFSRLMPVSVIDDQGRPIRAFVTDDEKRELALLRREVLSASFRGSLYTVILDRIGERYGPTPTELAAVFAEGVFEPHQVDAFARAFAHYWAGRFDEAIHVALPRIEAVLRHILVATGGIAYTEPHGGHAGHYKTLGTILSELHGRLADEGWRRSMRIVLAEPAGLNLRNRYLHGLVVEVEHLHAALVLQIVAYLWLLAPRDDPQDFSPNPADSTA